MPEPENTHVAAEAFKILRTLYQVSTELFSSETKKELVFRILNNTVKLFRYDRAVLWSFTGKKKTLEGISGREEANRHSEMAELWAPLVESIRDKRSPDIFKESFPDQKKQETWTALSGKTSGLSVMWVPLIVNSSICAGLWLERWGEENWEFGECEVMKSFSQNMSLAWKHFLPKIHWYSISGMGRRITFIMVLLLITAALFLVKLPLRIVSSCEIIPENPEMIAAPMDGVIKEVHIKPGQTVQEGDLLFTFEERVILKELKVLQKQVQIIQSQYDRIRFKAFKDDEAMQEIRSLKYRLDQENIRLQLAESNATHLVVKAPLEGVCMVDNPEYWRGRPVQIGERIITLFQPRKSKVKILLPENDDIAFDRKRPVTVILNADPATKHLARLTYVAPQSSKKPEGGAYFLAEAALVSKESSGIRVGSKGSAVVFGEEVPLIYWLLRKPLAIIRQFIGY